MAFPEDRSASPTIGRRIYGFMWGIVLNNNDPEVRGRVRTNVPGLKSDMKWAVVVGVPGAGAEKRGGYMVPRVDSQVLVGFIQGDIDEPFCMFGPPALNETPAVVNEKTTATTRGDIAAYETDTFELFVVDTATEKKIMMRSKDGENLVEIDAIDHSVHIKAANAVIVEAGLVHIDAARVQIKGRPVLPTGEPI